MRKVVNECCNCAVPGYPCRGSSCPNRHVVRLYCDECKTEGKLYEFDGKELCGDCLLKEFPMVEGSDQYFDF